MSPPPRKPVRPTTKAGAAVAAIAAAVAIATPLAQRWEGYRGEAYLDPAKILTQCYGETRDIDPSRIYSKDECAIKMRERMRKDYAPLILDCVPSFIEPANRFAFGASIDASYNAGPAAFCRSPMAKAFNAGDYAKGCDAFVGWYETARKVWYRGLHNRRLDERATCRKGL